MSLCARTAAQGGTLLLLWQHRRKPARVVMLASIMPKKAKTAAPHAAPVNFKRLQARVIATHVSPENIAVI